MTLKASTTGRLGRLVAVAIVVAELASLGLATTAASAQTASQTQRLIKRQQQTILQQQRQIEENQRRIQAQQNQIAARGTPAAGAAAPADINRGIFGNIGNCPVGWTYNLFNGCLPAVVVVH